MYLHDVGQWEAIVSSLVKAGTDIYTKKIETKAVKSQVASQERVAAAQQAAAEAAERQAKMAMQAAQFAQGGTAGGMSRGTMIGLVVGGVAVVGLAALAVMVFMKKKPSSGNGHKNGK